MIISDLSYLEVVSEVPSIVGGKRENKTELKQRIRITVKKSNTGDINAINESSVITSNDNR